MWDIQCIIYGFFMGQPSPFGLSSEITPLAAEANPYVVSGRFSFISILVGDPDDSLETVCLGAIGGALEELICKEDNQIKAANNIVRFSRAGAQSAQSGLSPINTMNRMANLRMHQLASQRA
jgi:hypothetical protein